MGVNHRGRLIAVMAGTLALFLAVGARLVYLHCFLDEDIIKHLLERQHVLVPITSSRGSIFDRNMHEMATTVMTQSLYAVPSEIQMPAKVAEQLAPVLDMRSADLMSRVGSSKSFVWIARQLETAVADRVRELKIDGLHFIPEPRRYYPKSTLVAHLVGITGIDGEGLEGLERRYDSVLRGKDGHIVTLRDAKGRHLIPLLDERQEPAGGNHLVLTIDEDLQHVAQEALRRACERYTPRRGMVVMEDPRTGDIVAVANWPEFDPNDFVGSSADTRRNAAFVDLFEPGSVFKVVTAVGALEERVVELDEEIDCHNGRLRYCGDTITDVHPLERATFVEIIAQSSNIGTIEVAARLGPERFNEYMRRMGFGQLVGMDFPGEPRGILRPLGRWSRRSMGALPIGQEVAVTSLQLVQAFSAIANGGIMVKPRILRAVLANDGSVIEKFEPETVRAVCSPQVAQITTELLCGVVSNGTGSRAAVEGYRVAGKTGTGQIALPGGGGFCRDRHTTVFAGYVPADDPLLTIVVVLDSPQTEPRLDTGGRVAAPVFREIAQNSLRIAGVVPQLPEPEMVAADRAVTDEPVTVAARPREEAAAEQPAAVRRVRVRMPLNVLYDAAYEEPVSPVPADDPSKVSVIARREEGVIRQKPTG